MSTQVTRYIVTDNNNHLQELKYHSINVIHLWYESNNFNRYYFGRLTNGFIKIVIILAIAITVFCSCKEEKVLVFSKTLGMRHKSIEPGIKAIQQMGEENRFIVVATEDSTYFKEKNLGISEYPFHRWVCNNTFYSNSI